MIYLQRILYDGDRRKKRNIQKRNQGKIPRLVALRRRFYRPTSFGLIYIYTISSQANPSCTFHFNFCACWLEIRIQITRVTIGTFFFITTPLFELTHFGVDIFSVLAPHLKASQLFSFLAYIYS